ncbi:MAG: PKD domain-containing protein [Thermoplasmata archaeon]|nr:PKD domain-containing protein [Thermoplasmata archaeon]
MFIQKRKRAVGIGIMLVLTTFVGMTANVSGTGEPPIADAGGPYTGEECTSMLLNASGSSDPDSDPLTYRWNIEGSWYDNANYTYLEWTWLDDFSGEITLEVSDGDLTALDTAVVLVLNVPPVILNVTGPTDVDVDVEMSLMVNFFDGLPDPRGMIASLDTYTATFSWGDGSSTEFSLGVNEFNFSGTHVYTEAGAYQINITIVDDNGGEASAIWEINVDGDLALVEAGPDGVIDEGSMFVSVGFLADDSGTYTAQVDYGDGTGAQELLLNLGNTFDLQHLYCDNGVYTVLVTAFNEGKEWESDSAIVTVNNVAPTIESMSGPPTDPIRLGNAIYLVGVFTDPGVLDSHIALIQWGDTQTTTVNLSAGVYQVNQSHTYASAGVYIITLTVTDDDGGSDAKSIDTYVVVYDPNCGFVTGGGWIIALPGSYPANPDLTGRCNFGFVSKYKKGHNTPEGNTEFQFQLGSLNFHSHTYEWLLISGAKATYKGEGTINGVGHYGFRLTAIDGKINRDGSIDKFRIKIWDTDNNDLIVFDNNLGAPDDQNPSTVLSGGQITIHKA